MATNFFDEREPTEDDLLNIVGGAPAPTTTQTFTAAPTPAPTAAQQTPSYTPQNLFQSFLSGDPKAAERLRSNYTQAFLMGEGSTFNDPGELFGGYNFR